MLQYSMGDLVDKLTIVHLKIWHLEEEIANETGSLPDEEVERMCDQIVNLNTHRNEIIRSINELHEAR